MSLAKSSRSFIKMLLSILLIAHSYSLSATVMNYDSCIADKNNSYSVGGWCFYIYRNSSWGVGVPLQSIAQTMCLPYGNLAVGVTYRMLSVFLNHTNIGGQNLRAWIALLKYGNVSSTQGWHWVTPLPNGGYANFSAIFANIPWGNLQPDYNTPPVRALIDKPYTNGIDDVYDDVTYYGYKLAIICQFAAHQWSYSKKANGRFAGPDFLIEQTSTTRFDCVHQCHAHPGCVSVTFKSTNNDCQLYNASPVDPRFTANVTTDSTYDWYVRNGMEY